MTPRALATGRRPHVQDRFLCAFLAFCLAVLSSLVGTSAISAHGVPDQINIHADRIGAASCHGWIGGEIPKSGQRFVMDADTLVAMDLSLGIIPALTPPGGVMLKIHVRLTDLRGPVVATAERLEPKPPHRTMVLAHFDLDPALEKGVASRPLYVELEFPRSTDGSASPIGWYGQAGNPYPRGTGVLCYSESVPPSPNDPERDFEFRALSAVNVCPQLARRVPAAALSWALNNAESVRGFGQRRVEGLPPGPHNPVRQWLTVQTWGLPYHPMFNPLVFKVGCP
jgi:hypothetical protein